VKLRITLEGKTYEVDVEILPEAEPELQMPESVLQPAHPPDTRLEDQVCRSPIAGVVLSVEVALQQAVRRDDPVVIIEAMKMQTAIGAPLDGTIAEVHVAPGDIVKPGQPLCTLS
jgi:biotin carboxyl carrier protein